MAKVIKATILMLSEAPDGQPGAAGKAVAKYVVGDDADPAVNLVKLLEVSAAGLSRPADQLFAEVVSKLRSHEGIE